MAKSLQKRGAVPVHGMKTDEDEITELDKEFFEKGKALDFQTYQQEVMQRTKEWPIKDPNKVFEQIIWNAKAAMDGSKDGIVIGAAQILRHLAELADYIPISLQRIAHISLSELPERKEIGANSDDIIKLD